MFYVREDDMDDLLRRAAENYEVDAHKAHDWEAVSASIQEAAPAPAVVQPKRKRRFIFWWLLIIPIGWLANYEWNKFQASQKTVPVAQQPSGTTQEKSSVPYENTQKDSAQIQAKDIPGKGGQVDGQLKTSDHDLYKLAGNNVSGRSSTTADLVPASPKPNAVTEDQMALNSNIVRLTDQPGKTFNNNDISIDKILPRQNPLPDLLNENDSKKDGTMPNVVASSSQKKDKSSTHYFYAGIIAGPDISFVKFQQAQGMGLNAGLIVGYKFNRLSVETGVIYAKKNYYTKGEYFDKSEIPFFSNAEILSVDGYCHMFEIPINARYNFSEKKNHAWFASAGFSSYLMDKEYYNYNYIRNDTAHQGGYAYYNASKNWFSILNLSAGYELKTGNKTNLRIEPYYKIPVTGVGMGSISLSSAGINVGITRRIP